MTETGTVPSEVNDIPFIFDSGRPMNSSNTPFTFYDDDGCGNETPIDISPYGFEMFVTLNGCQYLYTSTLMGGLVKGSGDDNNKLWLDITGNELKRGQYDYKIYFIDGVSVISGKLEIR